MADEQTQTATEDKDPKWYREQIEAEKAEKADLKAQLMDQAFEMAGVDTTKGLGKTMRQHYDGSAKASEILEWAAENYEYSPTSSGPASNPQSAQDFMNQTIHQAHERQGDVGGTGAGQTDQPVDALRARIAQAEQDKDWPTAVSLKNQLMVEMAAKGQTIGR